MGTALNSALPVIGSAVSSIGQMVDVNGDQLTGTASSFHLFPLHHNSTVRGSAGCLPIRLTTMHSLS